MKWRRRRLILATYSLPASPTGHPKSYPEQERPRTTHAHHPRNLQKRTRILTAIDLALGLVMFALLFMPTGWAYITALRLIVAPPLIIISVLAWRLDRKRKQLAATRP